MKASGLPSNTRVCIMNIPTPNNGLPPKFIQVQTLENAPRMIFLPRIRFKFGLRNLRSYKMTRVQFPLRLAYAMTVNKSQSQSVDMVLLDLTLDPLSHGPTYVAISRIRLWDNIRVIVTTEKVDTESPSPALGYRAMPIIRNVVYPSIIQYPPVLDVPITPT